MVALVPGDRSISVVVSFMPCTAHLTKSYRFADCFLLPRSFLSSSSHIGVETRAGRALHEDSSVLQLGAFRILATVLAVRVGAALVAGLGPTFLLPFLQHRQLLPLHAEAHVLEAFLDLVGLAGSDRDRSDRCLG